MTFRRIVRERPQAFSRIALSLVLIGLALGGVWILTIVGLAIEFLVRAVL